MACSKSVPSLYMADSELVKKFSSGTSDLNSMGGASGPQEAEEGKRGRKQLGDQIHSSPWAETQKVLVWSNLKSHVFFWKRQWQSFMFWPLNFAVLLIFAHSWKFCSLLEFMRYWALGTSQGGGGLPEHRAQTLCVCRSGHGVRYREELLP